MSTEPKPPGDRVVGWHRSAGRPTGIGFDDTALKTFSQQLKTARRNADSLISNAQSTMQLQRLKTGFEEWENNLRKEAQARLGSIKQFQPSVTSGVSLEEWDLVKRLGNNARQPSSKVGMRKSQSAHDFKKLLRVKPADGLSSGATGSAKEWDLVTALNNTFTNGNGTPPKPLFHVPTAPALQLQAAQVLGEERVRELEVLAGRLLAGPKEAVRSCQQTLENCQENLHSLGSLLQHRLPPAAQRRLTDAAAGGPSASAGTSPVRSRFTTSSALVVPGGAELAAHGAADQGLPWAVLPSHLRAREIAAIEEAIADDGGRGQLVSEPGEPGPSGQPAGPLQAAASERARQRKGRQGGSSLREPGRRIAIYTTASLPWMTGTAVNPLLRAAYLSRDSSRQVTLVVPWLAPCDQAMIFPNNMTFETPEEQEQYVKSWVQKRTGFDCNFKVAFYPGRYAAEKCSILPVGDPTQYIPDSEADVAVLEEPEHLNWYHHGRRWTDKFRHVVGVMHTNYLDYARREEHGGIKEALLRHMNSWVTRIHCHKVVKLSDAVQPLPRQTTEFVHGVPASFLAVGEAKAEPPPDGKPRFTRGAYFMGKAVWAKGYTELLELLERQAAQQGAHPHIDCYGNGEDLPDVAAKAAAKGLDLQFHGAKDHLDASMHEYRVFVNPSRSDVVATTTAEALAMGKWVLVQEHASNQFFSSFSNCLVYKTPEEFTQKLQYALSTDPQPMSAEERRRLTWEDATERFLSVAELDRRDKPGPIGSALDHIAWVAHNTLTGVEPLRTIGGAGVNTRDNPPSLLDYQPQLSESPGFFDSKQRIAARAQLNK